VPAGPNSAYAGVASGRIINMKHSSGQSSRVWDRVARAAASTTSAGPSSRSAPSFPALASKQRTVTSGPPVNTQPYRQQQRSTPWSAAAASSPAPSAPDSTPRMASGGPRPAAARLSAAAFPALPKVAPQPKPSMSGNVSLRNITGPQGPEKPAWGAGGNSTPSEPEADEANEEEQAQGKGKGKGKGKNKKITLFTMGQRLGQLS